MKISLLNLISTPIAVLNSVGFTTRVGLSSNDPKLQRAHSKEYQGYLTIYSPEGVLLGREDLGVIPANRRRLFNVSDIARKYVSNADHLCVAHRIPCDLLDQVSHIEESIELDNYPDYSLFRSLVEYSYPNGGNASIVYETPPRMNVYTTDQRLSETLSFTSKIVFSEAVDTHVLLINYSMDASYTNVCEFNFSVYSMAGDKVAENKVSVGPFSPRLINLRDYISPNLIAESVDPTDGLATFSYIGFTDEGSNITIIINSSEELGGISMEHCHAAQEYLLPRNFDERKTIKSNAIKILKTGIGRI